MAVPGLSRRRLAVLVLALLVLTGGGCATQKVYREGTSTIPGQPGELIVIELESNPTTGHSWMMVAQPEAAVATLMETDFAMSPPSALGQGGGHQRWTFRLVGRGSTTATFGYGRTWENAPAQKATMFTITVR